MTIKVYPSPLEGEPLEIHETDKTMSVEDWLLSVAPDYKSDAYDKHPTVRINKEIIPPIDWGFVEFNPTDDVEIYIEAKAEWVALAISLIAVAVALSNKPGTPKTRQQKTLEEPGAFANQARWGEPIPEIAGSPIVYPDYITPPHRRYVDKREQWVEALVCVGYGFFLKDQSQVYVGGTPIPLLGDDAEITFYEPGESISEAHREWWHTCDEVGFTTLGGSGMTLGPATDIDQSWSSVFSFSGDTITGNMAVPDSWETGMIMRVEAEHPINFDGDSISSSLLDTLDIEIGDTIELTGSRADSYIVSSIVADTVGQPGSPSTITGSAPPARFDFSVDPINIVISIGSNTYGITVLVDVASSAELADAINQQMFGDPIAASVGPNGEIILTEISPYSGLAMSFTWGEDQNTADIFGSPSFSIGTPTVEPSGVRYHVAGANFGTGTEVATVGRPGFLYSIVGISGNTLTVNPLNVSFWTGFPVNISDATSSASLDPSSQEGGWIGPFKTTPPGETSDCFEVDIFYPAGLIHYTSKGYWRDTTSSGVIQWRRVGDAAWTDRVFSHTEQIPDQIGFTIRVDSTPNLNGFEVRVRADGLDHKMQWGGLRSRILGAPSSYPGMTTAHIRISSGDRISGGVENKVSLRAQRILPTVEDENITAPTRDIIPFFIYMMGTVGYGRSFLDMPKLTALHNVFVSRGDTFDFSMDSDSTLKVAANYCLAAGFSELNLHMGKISAVRDGPQAGIPSRIFSPQEMTEYLTETTETIMPDDIDGVDVEYSDYITGRTLTAEYRLPGDQGLRVEVIKAPGVTDRTRAWRIAARHRRITAFRRTAYSGQTEMAAMNSFYWDFVGLQDGIADWGQSAFVVDQVGPLEFIISEPVIFVGGDLVVRIRNPDGTATEPVEATFDGHNVTLSSVPSGATINSDPNSPTVFYLGQNLGIAHQAFMTELSPREDGRVDFRAVRYDERVYEEDDNAP